MAQGIYKLVNNINDKVYVGYSKDIKRRFEEHMYNLKNNKHHSYKLQDFYNEFKHDKLLQINYVIIELVDDEKYLPLREKYYIKLYNSFKNGYNSMDMCGNRALTKKEVQQNKKLHTINEARSEYKSLTTTYKDNLYLKYNGYNDTYLYRVNEAIKYFVKNYNLDLYKAEILQYKSNVELLVIDKNYLVVQKHVYKTKYKTMGLNTEEYKHRRNISTKYHDRYKKFDNIVKSRNRYIWFMKMYYSLDEDILRHNSLKYSKDKYSIPLSYIIEYIGYQYRGKFKQHIINDKDVKKVAKQLGIEYINGKAILHLDS